MQMHAVFSIRLTFEKLGSDRNGLLLKCLLVIIISFSESFWIINFLFLLLQVTVS